MDINKEREVFEKLPLAKLAIESEYVYYNQETNSYWPNEDFCLADAPEAMNFAWEAWQAAKAQAVPMWISVKNAMPKAGSQVLTYDDYGFVSVENIDGCEDPNNVYFSHWLPLPPVEQEPAND